MRKYYLNVHSNTFIWIKGDTVCVYNTDNGGFLRTPCCDELRHLVNEIQEIDKLYSVIIDEELFVKPSIKTWIEGLINIQCCEFMVYDETKALPVSLAPILKITDDLEYYKEGHCKEVNESILSNLHQLVIHLNGSKYGNNQYARQCIYPYETFACQNVDELCVFITSAGKPYFLSQIVLVGCIWEYEKYGILIDFLMKLSIKVSIYCTEADYINYAINQKIEINENCSFCILKSLYMENEDSFHMLVDKDRNDFHFLISSEKDYISVEELVRKYTIEHYRIIPIYTNYNADFFKQYIYISEDDIQNNPLSKREIFVHQTLNTNYFGTLHILPNAHISGGDGIIGTLSDTLYAIIYKEMTEGFSWFQIRDRQPCCDCVYQWLCPSPSFYESIIGKPNLCHVLS